MTDALTPFTTATRARAEAVYAARVPDFAAMLTRARELDPDVVSEAVVHRAEALAPVIPIQHAHRDRSDHDALAPFMAATRAVLAEQATQPRRPPPPPLPRPRRTLAVGLTLLTAFAAAVLLWQGPRVANLLAARGHNVEAVADTPDEPLQPLHPGEPRRATTPALAPTEAPALTPPADAPALAPPADASTLAPPADASTLAPPADAPALAPPALAPATPPAAKRRPPRPPSSSPTATTPLEDEAQALWQRGELVAAEQKFRQVVQLAGKSARAELAYGDLFALAGQIRGPAGQTALAREYLAAFPSGRYADDMRAGLCQRAPADERPTCWRDYLARHPSGAHRRAAEAALEAP